jgi:hypothetical protein
VVSVPARSIVSKLTVVRARRCYCLRFHRPTCVPYMVFRTNEDLSQSDGFIVHGLSDTHNFDIPAELNKVLKKLSNIDGCLDPCLDLPEQTKRQRYSDEIYDVELTLLRMYDDEFAQVMTDTSTLATLPDLVQMASYLYVLFTLRQINKGFSMVQNFVRSLSTKLAAYRVEHPVEDAKISDLILSAWVEAVNCCCTTDSNVRVEGAAALVSLVDALGVSTVDELHRTLRKVAWAKENLNKELRGLWACMEASRG